MTPPLACAALEIALNRYLRQEPAALAECGRLAGRRLEFRVEQPPWSFSVELAANGVRVSGEAEGKPDVSVRATLTQFLRLGARSVGGAGDPGRGGLPAGLDVQGDSELLSRFNRLLAGVGFDLEEPLARYLGDGAAHRVAEGLKALFDWGRKTADTLLLDTSEYLREETYDLARRADVEEWMDAVDALRSGVDRLEARLQRAEAASSS